MLCKYCTAGRCVDEPTKECSVSIACPRCNEAGCDQCDNTGFFELTSCPKRTINRELLRAIRLADLMKQGIPPVGGGVLDQSAYFVSFYEAFRAEQNRAENESYNRD